MKNAMIVFKKEFYRVVSDKRLLIMSVLFPGLMIFMMYSLMGSVMEGETEDIQMHEMIVYTENAPDLVLAGFQNVRNYSDKNEDGEIDATEYDLVPIELHTSSDLSKTEIDEKILSGEIDLYVKFPVDFETAILDYEDPNYVIPSVEISYNPGENYSSQTYANITSVLFAYSEGIAVSRFGDDINAFNTEPTIIMNEDKAQGQAFAMLLPMLIIMFLFSGAMSIGPDSIAGEKERGTIATLLVTPVKRSEIAIGKVLSLSVVAFMSAVSSFIGIILSLPMLVGEGDGGETVIPYGIVEYIQIFVVLLATVLVIVGIVSVVSAYAKSIKEASMLILPFYFISIIVGITSMFSSNAAESAFMYLIPLYSSVNMLISILMFNVVPLHFIVTVISSVVYVAILIYIMNRLFSNEKVMFSK